MYFTIILPKSENKQQISYSGLRQSQAISNLKKSKFQNPNAK